LTSKKSQRKTRKKNSSRWPDFKPAGYDPYLQADGFKLDEARGQKVIDFFSECLTHVRGPLKGTPFILEPWLEAIVGHLYGWVSVKTGLRRYRELLLFIPRKNAKTLLGAGLGLVEMFLGDQNTPECMIGSGDREQARQLHDTIKMMVQNEPELSSRLSVYKNIIKCPGNDGFLKVVSSEAYNLHGANLSLALIDETHVVSRDLVEIMQTSQGAREEPLIVNLSTAGYDRHSILYEKYDYAKKVCAGVVNDPAFMPIVYEAPENADFTDEKAWEQANPNLDKSISRDFLRRECSRAQESPVFEATFRTLYMNQWVESFTPWLAMHKYDACVGEIPDLTGRPCYGGLDLATTIDLSAFVLVFPPQEQDEPFFVKPFAWVPNDTILERSKRDKVPYNTWRDQGFIEATEGAVIDYKNILRRIDEVAKTYDLKAVYFDRWGATRIYQDLEDMGLEVVQFGQGYKSMSAPTKELMRLILENKIIFPENPVLRWCASNIVIETDVGQNIKINKKKSTDKVDPMVALVMGLDAALKDVYENPYEEDEVLFI